MPNDSKYKQMAIVMKAMAHPTRLFILDKLNEREHCVCELQELIGADMSTVSRHLSVLRNAGIIDNRKENNQVFYSLLCPCVLDIYQCVIEVNKTRGGK
ncbi:MAG: ArsR/SmtB family transcription factor [Candidatus Syntrophosphaera sp.]